MGLVSISKLIVIGFACGVLVSCSVHPETYDLYYKNNTNDLIKITVYEKGNSMTEGYPIVKKQLLIESSKQILVCTKTYFDLNHIPVFFYDSIVFEKSGKYLFWVDKKGTFPRDFDSRFNYDYVKLGKWKFSETFTFTEEDFANAVPVGE